MSLPPSCTDDLPCNLQGIASGSEQTCANVVPGTYTVTESALSTNGRFVSLRCDDPNNNSTFSGAVATIRVEANETVRCVWVNEDRRGWVIVEKQAPATHDPSLEPAAVFTDDLPCNLQGIASGSEQTCANVVPGTYTVTESALSTNGRFVSLRCDDPNNNSTFSGAVATIHLEADETVRCTWVNEVPSGQGTATNVALTDELPAGPDLSWSLDPAVAGCSIEGRLLSCTFGSLTDGETISVHVTSPTTTASCGRYDNTAFAQADNRTAVQRSASVTVVCPATMTYRKETLPASDPQDFAFVAAGVGVDGDTLDTDPGSATPSSHTDTLDTSELAGTKTIAESVPPGWVLSSVVCTGTSATRAGDAVSFSVSAGAQIVCTFTNTKLGSVTLRKTTNAVVDPSKDILFILTGPGLPADGVRRSTFGDQDGLLEFGSGNLIPAQTYKICETPVPAGFTSFWKLDRDIVTPYNPDASKSPPEDLGTRCYDFKVEPGQARSFEVDNSRPGGDPRTIGYWKNWNRCTSGNQAATAQKNGGAAAGFFLAEDLLPQTHRRLRRSPPASRRSSSSRNRTRQGRASRAMPPTSSERSCLPPASTSPRAQRRARRCSRRSWTVRRCSTSSTSPAPATT